MDSPPWMNSTLRFFKVVRRTNMPFLRFPKDFVDMNLNNPPAHVVLTTGDGREWRVDISRDSQGLKMDGGWDLFRDHYTFHLNDCLVFLFDRSTRFAVSILDDATRMERRIVNNSEGRVAVVQAVGGSTSKRSLELRESDIQCSQPKRGEGMRYSKRYGKSIKQYSPTPFQMYTSEGSASDDEQPLVQVATANRMGNNSMHGQMVGSNEASPTTPGALSTVAGTGICGLDLSSGSAGRKWDRAFSNYMKTCNMLAGSSQRRDDRGEGPSRGSAPPQVVPVIDIDQVAVVPPGGDPPATPDMVNVIILPDPRGFAVVRDNHIIDGLELPLAWARANLTEGSNERTLVYVDTGREFNVEVELLDERCNFSYGWIMFVIANAVKVRDLIELVADPGNDKLWNVKDPSLLKYNSQRCVRFCYSPS